MLKDLSLYLDTVIHNATRYTSLVFQPQYRLSDKTLVGAEALLRWEDPHIGNSISPSEFIRSAEVNGAIQKIGDWVFKVVASHATRISAMPGIPDGFHLASNISPMEFRDDNHLLPRKWIDRVKSENYPKGRMVLEITENALIKNHDLVSYQISEARDVGIEIAIDDFGTGYSSLAYLSKFDVKFLKLDKSFIDALTTSKRTALLVKGVIDMAHTMEMIVIAEGVETEDQFDILNSFGCDYMQGFLLSKPLSEKDFYEVIHKSFNGASGYRL